MASDHAPYTVEEKETNPADIFTAPAGFPGLETRLPLMMRAVREHRITPERAAALLSANPARIFGLTEKGRIEAGYDADYVLLDPYQEYRLDAGQMLTKARDICHFLDGMPVSGKPLLVFRRGEAIYCRGSILAKPAPGNGSPGPETEGRKENAK